MLRRNDDHVEMSAEEELEYKFHMLDAFVERCDRQFALKIATLAALAVVAFAVGLFGADALMTGGTGPRVAIYRWFAELAGEASPRPTITARPSTGGSFTISPGPPTKIFGIAALASAAVIGMFMLGVAVPCTREILSDLIVWSIGITAAMYFACLFVSMAY